MRSPNLLPETVTLARELHWGESEIFAIPLRRRLAYLLLLEHERDAALLDDLMEEPNR